MPIDSDTDAWGVELGLEREEVRIAHGAIDRMARRRGDLAELQGIVALLDGAH